MPVVVEASGLSFVVSPSFVPRTLTSGLCSIIPAQQEDGRAVSSDALTGSTRAPSSVFLLQCARSVSMTPNLFASSRSIAFCVSVPVTSSTSYLYDATHIQNVIRLKPKTPLFSNAHGVHGPFSRARPANTRQRCTAQLEHFSVSQVTSIPKALRSYDKLEGMAHLTGGNELSESLRTNDSLFPAADIGGHKPWPATDYRHSFAEMLPYDSDDDVLDLLSKDMKTRLCFGVGTGEHRQKSRRELISRMLFAAAALVGPITITAEYAVAGTRAHGAIDWGLFYKELGIIVCEVIAALCSCQMSCLPTMLLQRHQHLLQQLYIVTESMPY